MKISKKTAATATFVLILSVCCMWQTALAAEAWVGTWASSQQLAESHNNPPSPYLANNTLRQVVRATLGGNRVRVQFSNKYTTSGGPITINSAHIAVSTGGSSINTATDTALTFNGGSASVTIPTGQEIYSDAADFNVAPLSKLAVSINFGTASSTNVTGHPGSRTDSYIKSGNAVSTNWTADGTKANWWILSRIDLLLDETSGCVAILGDSITDGRGSTTNGNNRWPDILAERLHSNPGTAKAGVINHGVGGNALYGGLGVAGRTRFDHDIIEQPGVKWVIIFEGINDITGNRTANEIITVYQEFINKAHTAGLVIYGATITPFKGNSGWTTARESVRLAVNNWIKTSGQFDGVIDFCPAVCSPTDANQLNSAYLFENDYLHLNPAGYQAMGNSIDLSLFAEKKTADLDESGFVDFVDFAVLGSQWRELPGEPSADIAPAGGDGIIDLKDVNSMAQEWLWEV